MLGTKFKFSESALNHWVILQPLALCFIFCFLVSLQGQGKDKDLNSKTASDLSEDLFKVHDFDVKIDLQVPSSGVCASVCVEAQREGPKI